MQRPKRNHFRQLRTQRDRRGGANTRGGSKHPNLDGALSGLRAGGLIAFLTAGDHGPCLEPVLNQLDQLLTTLAKVFHGIATWVSGTGITQRIKASRQSAQIHRRLAASGCSGVVTGGWRKPITFDVTTSQTSQPAL